MATRSKTRQLNEEELRILSEQLDKKQELLREQEKSLMEKDHETQGKLEALEARQREMTSTSEPSNLPNEQFSALQKALSTLVSQMGNLRTEITEIKNERSGQTRPPPSDSIRPEPTNHFCENHSNPVPRNQNLKFKDALESVPIFNGYNIPVLRFIRSCKRARDMFTPNLESNLTQLLRNKLKGHAATALEDYTFDNVSDFADRLKILFGSAKTLNEFRGELGNITKLKSEHIIDYISRIKDLHMAIKEAELDNHGLIRSDQYDTLDNDTLDCFTKGLPPDFRMRLKLEGFLDLEDAYSKAIKVEKEMSRDRSQFRPDNKPSVAQVKTLSPSERPACSHCSRNHPSENCWQKFPEKRPAHGPQFKPTNNNNNASQPNTERDNRSRPPCAYCQKPGHSEPMCYKKQNDERNRAPSDPKNSGSRPVVRASPRDEIHQERPVRTIEALPCEPSGSA